MLPDSVQLASLVAEELRAIVDPSRRSSVQALLRMPSRRSVGWDYGSSGARIDVWIIGGTADGSVDLVYASEGFGPSYPWGFIFPADDSSGMDSQWHAGLEHAAIGAGILNAPPGYEVP
jgi:hypothetical protein